MDVTELGMTTDASEEQEAKARSMMDVVVQGSEIINGRFGIDSTCDADFTILHTLSGSLTITKLISGPAPQ